MDRMEVLQGNLLKQALRLSLEELYNFSKV
jgi:hypothetical protein